MIEEMRKSSFSRKNSIKKNKSVSFADEIGEKLCTVQSYPASEINSLSWEKENFNFITENGDKTNLNEPHHIIHTPQTRAAVANCSNMLPGENNSSDDNVHRSSALLRHGICALSQPYRNWIILFDTNSLVYNPTIHNIKLTKINVIVINGIPKVCGMITVKNLTYEKFVFVRYTFYEWITFNDKNALFHLHDDQLNADHFKFCIPLIVSGSNSRNFEFAVCFQTSDNRTFWDNNFGQNYKIKYKNHSISKSS